MKVSMRVAKIARKRVVRKSGLAKVGQYTALLLAVLVLSGCGAITGISSNFSGVIDFQNGLSVNYGVGLVVLDHKGTPSDQELLINSDFNNQHAWASCSTPANSNISDGGLHMSGNSCVYQTVPAIAGDDYTLTCDSSANTNYAEATLVMLDSNFNTIDEQTVVIENAKAGSNSSFLTAPAGTTYAAATLYSEGEIVHYGCSLKNTTDPVTPPAPSPTPPNPAPVPSDELLTNPGFDGATGWTNCGNASAYDISGGSLNISGTACIFQTVEATAGANYTLTCDSASSADYSNISINMLDSDFMTMTSDIASISSNTKEATVSSLVAGAGTSYVGITIYSEGPAVHDNCSLVADAPVTPAPTPSPTPAPAPTPSPTPSPAPSGDNLLSNPSFDTFDDWFTCSNTPNTNYGIGTGAFVAAGTACAFQTLEVIAGASYSLTCNGQSDAITSNIILSLLDGNYNQIAEDTVAVNSATSEAYSASIAANASASFVSVTLYNDSGSTQIFDCNLTSDTTAPVTPAPAPKPTTPAPAPSPAPAPAPAPTITNTVLQNPSFDGNDSWTVCAGPNQGNYGIGTGNWAANGTACAFQTVAVVPNEDYVLSCSGQTDALTSNISLSMLDSNFNIITQITSPIVNGTDSVVSVPATAGSSFVSVTLYNTDGSTQISECSLTSN